MCVCVCVCVCGVSRVLYTSIQLFDAARDMASQCHGTKRLLENVKVEKQSRMHNLEAADGKL